MAHQQAAKPQSFNLIEGFWASFITASRLVIAFGVTFWCLICHWCWYFAISFSIPIRYDQPFRSWDFWSGRPSVWVVLKRLKFEWYNWYERVEPEAFENHGGGLYKWVVEGDGVRVCDSWWRKYKITINEKKKRGYIYKYPKVLP